MKSFQTLKEKGKYKYWYAAFYLFVFLVLLPSSVLSAPPEGEQEGFELTDNSDDWYYKNLEQYKGWRYIVIHHSATSSGNVEGFHRFHSKQGWGGIAYHYVIGNGKGMGDGEVEATFRWQEQISGAHSSINSWKYNIFGIGICLVGNFEETVPTPKQLDALETLVLKLSREYAIDSENIVTHAEVPFDKHPDRHEQTLCPGKQFEVSALRQKNSNYLEEH